MQSCQLWTVLTNETYAKKIIFEERTVILYYLSSKSKTQRCILNSYLFIMSHNYKICNFFCMFSLLSSSLESIHRRESIEKNRIWGHISRIFISCINLYFNKPCNEANSVANDKRKRSYIDLADRGSCRARFPCFPPRMYSFFSHAFLLVCCTESYRLVSSYLTVRCSTLSHDTSVAR